MTTAMRVARWPAWWRPPSDRLSGSRTERLTTIVCGEMRSPFEHSLRQNSASTMRRITTTDPAGPDANVAPLVQPRRPLDVAAIYISRPPPG
jgi:hypothetical protein